MATPIATSATKVTTNGIGELKIVWTDPQPGVTFYHIYRESYEGKDSWATAEEIPASPVVGGVFQILDNPTPNNYFRYSVQAENVDGLGPFSDPGANYQSEGMAQGNRIQPMQFGRLERCISDFLQAAMGFGIPVVKENVADAAKRQNPSASFKVGPATKLGDDDERGVGKTYETIERTLLTGIRRFTVTVNLYGKDSRSMMVTLQSALQNGIYLRHIRQEGASVARIGIPTDVGALLETKIEERMRLEFDVYAPVSVEMATGAIETVEFEAEIGDTVLTGTVTDPTTPSP